MVLLKIFMTTINVLQRDKKWGVVLDANLLASQKLHMHKDKLCIILLNPQPSQISELLKGIPPRTFTYIIIKQLLL